MNLASVFVTYQNGSFSASGSGALAGVTGSNFTRTATGQWVADFTSCGITQVGGAWGNVVQDNAAEKNFMSDLHLVETGGPSLDIYALKNGSPADDLQLKLLIQYN